MAFRRKTALAACVFTLALGACATTQGSTAPVASASPVAPAQTEAKAKNVILFIGDGMGISTITAARIYAGQKLGKSGEEHVLPFENFENVALVKTYNTNAQTPDSAGTATAMHSGVKTKIGMLGMGPEAITGDCASGRGHELPLLGEEVKRRGLALGIVSTARITHATGAQRSSARTEAASAWRQMATCRATGRRAPAAAMCARRTNWPPRPRTAPCSASFRQAT